jgi:ATP-dependent DNA ligase
VDQGQEFTIDGEAVMLGPYGLSRFDDLRRRRAAHDALLDAFDLMEHNSKDPQSPVPRSQGRAGATAAVFEHACQLGAEGIVT